MVMAQSLFMALKHLNHEHVIDVMAPPWSAPVLARMPEVRNVLEVDISHGELGLLKRLCIARGLRGRYDQAIVLPKSFKSALIPCFAGIPQRTAYRGEMRYWIVNDMRTHEAGVATKAVECYVALGADRSLLGQVPAVGFPALQVRADKRREVAGRLGIDVTAPCVALLPGAEFGPSKRWPARYFGELGALLSRQGFEVYVFGSSRERAMGEEVVDASGGSARSLCGQTSLEEAIDLLSMASVAIANDSGLMHVAAALKRPVVALYGATTPAYAPPLCDRMRIQYLDLDCSPCRERQCPYGHYACLRNLAVRRVYESAVELLAGDIPASSVAALRAAGRGAREAPAMVAVRLGNGSLREG